MRTRSGRVKAGGVRLGGMRRGAPVAALVVAATLRVAEGVARWRLTYIVSRDGAVLEESSELLARFTPRGRRLVPGAHVVIRNHFLSRRDVALDINSLGFRAAELPEEKAAGELRVLVLGDSITLGDYLASDEVYVERIEQQLRRALPRRRIAVINAGIGDSGLREEVDILEDHGLATRPDVVVIGFYLNDSRPPWGFPGELGTPGWLRRHSVRVETIYRQARLKRWLEEREFASRFRWLTEINRLDWAHDPKELERLATLAGYDWGAAWDPASWPVIRHELERVHALAAQHGFRVAIVCFPVYFQVYASFVDDRPQQRIGREAAELGFRFLDLLPVLRAQADDPKLFFDWCHPRERANAIIGAEIARFLQTSYGWTDD